MDPDETTPPAPGAPPAAVVTPPVTPPPAPADPAPDNVEGLLRQNKALLTELNNKKASLTTTSEELNVLKEEKRVAEVERLKKNGDNEALLKLEQDKNSKILDGLILAEMKAYAIKDGIIDMDAVALIPRDKIKIDENTFAVKGVEEAVASFKENKPSWFKLPEALTTTPQAAPGPKGTGAPVAPPPPASAPTGFGHLKPGSKEALEAISNWQAKYSS